MKDHKRIYITHADLELRTELRYFNGTYQTALLLKSRLEQYNGIIFYQGIKKSRQCDFHFTVITTYVPLSNKLIDTEMLQ